MTGNRIVSHQQQQVSEGKQDDTIVVSDTHSSNSSDQDNHHHHYSSKMRLQVIITEIPPKDTDIATPSKKTKKSKSSTTPLQISQYCVWILINETTLLPILLRLKENVASSNNAITTSDYGYTVQPQYRIVSANISRDDAMPMRCSFLHHHHSTNTNTQMKHPSQPPQLMVYQQSCLPSKVLSAINVQTVPLSLDMDVGKDKVITIQFDDRPNINKEQDNGMMIDDPDNHHEDEMDHN